jgi:PST family polysaccharide transporter
MARESIGARAAKSSGYLLLRRVVGYVIRFAAVAVLARQLKVAEFGVVAIAATCINIMVMFGAAGINSWVIYDREEGWEQRAKSAWWLNAVLTTGQVAVAASLVPVVVGIYGEPQLGPVLVALIVTFFIEQMREVPDALLERHLDFRKVAGRDMANDLLTGIGGVVMALTGCGLWSLILPRLLLSPVFLLVTMRLAHWTPGWKLYRADWRRIFKYTIHLIGSSLLHVMSNDGDTVIVGKLLGKAAVGFYNTAYILANLLGRSVTAVVVQVSVPALAKIRESTGDLGPTCIRMYRMLAIATSPALMGMFAIADDLVLLVYGHKWIPVVPVLRLFIIFTLVRTVTSAAGAVFRVVGRTEVALISYLILTPMVYAGVFIGSHWGVAGVALGVTIARVISGCISFSWSLSMVGASVASGFKALVPSTVASLVMAALVWGARHGLLQLGLALPVRVAVTVPLGVVAYVGVLRIISDDAFADFTRLATRLSPRAGAFLRLILGGAQTASAKQSGLL